jgi:hypothetical protein
LPNAAASLGNVQLLKENTVKARLFINLSVGCTRKENLSGNLIAITYGVQ